MPFTRAIPALNQGTSPLCGLVSSPLGGQIQDKTILTNPLKCWPIHANPGQSGANRAFCHLCQSYFKLPVQCHSAKAVPILQTYCQYASQMKMHKFNFDILTLHYLSPHTMLMCQSGAHLPIQRQSCTEIAYYGMPVSPSVNGRAVDRCIATESGLAQHWPPV